MLKIDIPVVLSRLKQAGISFEELAKETGLHSSRFRQIESERKPAPKAWNEAATLFDLYFKHVPDKTLPVYGKHHEDFK